MSVEEWLPVFDFRQSALDSLLSLKIIYKLEYWNLITLVKLKDNVILKYESLEKRNDLSPKKKKYLNLQDLKLYKQSMPVK